MRTRGGCSDRGVWLKFSAALRTAIGGGGEGGRRVVGTRGQDAPGTGRPRACVVGGGRGSGPALGTLPTLASGWDTNARSLRGSVSGGHGGHPGCGDGGALLKVHCRPPPRFLFPGSPARLVLRLQDLILHQEAGVSGRVAAQTEVLAPSGLPGGGLEVRAKREHCAGPCGGVCGKKRRREPALLWTLGPAAPASRSLTPRHPASCAPRRANPRTCLSRR